MEQSTIAAEGVLLLEFPAGTASFEITRKCSVFRGRPGNVRSDVGRQQQGKQMEKKNYSKVFCTRMVVRLRDGL